MSKRVDLVDGLKATKTSCVGPVSDPADAAALATIAQNAAAVLAVLESEPKSVKVVPCAKCGGRVEESRLQARAATCVACAKKAMQEPVPPERIAAMRRQIKAAGAKRAKAKKPEEPDPEAW